MNINLKQIIQNVREVLTYEYNHISDEETLQLIERYVLQDKQLSMRTYQENKTLIYRIFYAIRKDLDILQPLLENDQVSEIMVNGKDGIFIERNGKVEKMNLSFETLEDLEELIRRIVGKVHREINELTPIVDARLEDGSRVNAVYKNIALNGPILTIRKFPKKAINMETLIQQDSITGEAAAFLQKLVKAGYNCFISGGTSSGKTTFLNVLSNYIPSKERVIVIEDSAELQIKAIKNIVRLECKPANVQGKGEIDMQDLIKTSLRMRPDRIIVGEVRGREVVDMVQALNTGHDGSLSTGHGNSVQGMLKRLEAMYLQAANFPADAIRAQIAEGIDLIIHLVRLGNGKRKVFEIAEIKPYSSGNIETNTIYKYEPSKGLRPTGNQLLNVNKLRLLEELS